jgi:hypothetical protein
MIGPLILSAARRRPGQHRCGATGRGPGGYCGEDPAVVALHGHYGGGGLLDQGSGLSQGRHCTRHHTELHSKESRLSLCTDTMVEGNSWTRGQVSVMADTVQDIIQNYMVRNQLSVFAWTPWQRGLLDHGSGLRQCPYCPEHYTKHHDNDLVHQRQQGSQVFPWNGPCAVGRPGC